MFGYEIFCNRELSPTAREYIKRMSEEASEKHKHLSPEQQDFFTIRQRRYSEKDPYAEITEAIRSGRYSKPSEYILDRMHWIFGTFILPRHRDALLWAVDRCIAWPYTGGFFRPTIRSREYRSYVQVIIELIRNFSESFILDYDICDILTENLPEDALEYVRTAFRAFPPSFLAYELDRGNEKLESILENCILGVGRLSHQMIRGIVLSENPRMHQALGKLLLAARLQEGVRQSICEMADMGTVSAFMSIFEVIERNNLIRFSSVRRAVATWTGFIVDEVGKIDRINDKIVPLLGSCLRDREACNACLNSEDSMAIHMALFAMGVYAIQDAAEKVVDLIYHGSAHQVLSAGYYVSIMQESLSHLLAHAAIVRYPDRHDIVAVYIDGLLSPQDRDPSPASLPRFYKSRDGAIACYDALMRVYGDMKKSAETFSPCIFPWHSAKLERGMIAVKLCELSLFLGDEDKLDLACEMIPQCLTGYRRLCANLLLKNPTRHAQFAALFAGLGDREECTRSAVYEIAKDLPAEKLDVAALEDLLRIKANDARTNIVALLMKLSDGALADSIRRLIADKKEEKHCAAYELMAQALKDESRAGLKPAIEEICRGANPDSARERILLDSVKELLGEQDQNPVEALYSQEDAYKAEVVLQPEDEAVFRRYFPDSYLSGSESSETESPSCKQAMEDLNSLEALIDAHKDDVQHYDDGTTVMLGYGPDLHIRFNFCQPFPFEPLWNAWYDQLGDPARCLRACIAAGSDGGLPVAERLYGRGFNRVEKSKYANVICAVLLHLVDTRVPRNERASVARMVAMAIVRDFTDAEFAPLDANAELCVHYITILNHIQIQIALSILDLRDPAFFRVNAAMVDRSKEYCERTAAARHEVRQRSMIIMECSTLEYLHSYNHLRQSMNYTPIPKVQHYLHAWYGGAFGERTLLHFIFERRLLGDGLELLTMAQCLRSNDSGKHAYMRQRIVQDLLDHKDVTDDDMPFIQAVAQLADKVVAAILEIELKRGDSETPYSYGISSIQRVSGADNLGRILAALGKDTLVRSSWSDRSKRGVLSHLLSVSVPAAGDNVQMLQETVSRYGLTRRRLIETAMYAPAWVDLIGEYLNLPGFVSAAYYFMAHMNETFDERRMARIAQFTPLTADELNVGAFDVDWFRAAYDQIGPEAFEQLYDASKYISEGARHTRARKYADAALGRMAIEPTEALIQEKRNRDLLMAYALIPLQGDQDLLRRYLFIQEFQRQSKQFGAQRIASEKKASEMALTNLAVNAHIADVTRLTLRMEAQLMEDNRDLFELRNVDDIAVQMKIDVSGSASILCMKDGKELKAIPPRLKKDPYILRLTEAKKAFTEQYRRTKRLFEESMEEETAFTAAEIMLMLTNPVARPVLEPLVFCCGAQFGFIRDGELVQADGHVRALSGSEELFVAHPVHLQNAGVWSLWQQKLFADRIRQPFKQVFRELYVKTPEELNRADTLRYSGNQILSVRAAACLKARRWIADPEMGLQKIYYRENVIVNLFAQADWFTPSEVEAPTLEWVSFTDRKTYRPMKISEIPDVLFSEVMRDVDLAVSVAHAGQVDPETSHSTMEMRAALLEQTLAMLGLKNVRVQDNRALIDGALASYAVHLGSGVVHRQGGAMIAVLPVHSQHRGRIFLPFADDDPKTAEILSKVILFAEDKKIKDPSILEQI